MERPPSPDFTPVKRAGAILLLESVQWDPQRLTPGQTLRIRELFFLNSPESEMSVAELVQAGRIRS
ncbi:hypothetical protein [Methanoregula formicica]|uniref:Uncharacterized protein n=1 Tax=Methanoregula formicica (strain DSM 22288 / NBRC 105244 / SMSP) TaxID=593750 RepID=L0HF49_METFS|nr:hypothetical protein [Methanoregula formicica]AGB02421.1 hypothetical protein Metfor_1382 [Methanoregula formicica SMSP]